MAKKITKLVNAVDIEVNSVVRVQESEVVAIPVLQLGPGNTPIPATLATFPHWKPIRLMGIRFKGREWPLARFRTIGGGRMSCVLRNPNDARHPIFSGLQASSRARLLRASQGEVA